MGKEQKQDLNDFGRYFLGLSDRIAQMRVVIERYREQIGGLVGLGDVLDKDALSRGSLTGDSRLDAAICLSMFSPREKEKRENWIRASVQVYKAIVEVEEKLKGWKGGLVLYDATPKVSPCYWGEIILGRVSNPRLIVEFRKPGVRELERERGRERAVAIGVATYEHIDYFEAEFGVILPRYTGGILDITTLFDPYWGGDTDLRHQTAGPSAGEGVAGLFLGDAKIKRHLHNVRQRLSLGTDAREAVGFIDRIEQRFASLVTPDDPSA